MEDVFQSDWPCPTLLLYVNSTGQCKILCLSQSLCNLQKLGLWPFAEEETVVNIRQLQIADSSNTPEVSCTCLFYISQIATT